MLAFLLSDVNSAFDVTCMVSRQNLITHEITQIKSSLKLIFPHAQQHTKNLPLLHGDGLLVLAHLSILVAAAW